ncbi:MAG: TonB-dependent receptor [Gemmatimonadota bacterium]|nr:TonB-dependent receptor [Gemmatimonadota bacterium]MDH3422439.1 TonB-dependent receptor [Gemmatimonadota bacterium]
MSTLAPKIISLLSSASLLMALGPSLAVAQEEVLLAGVVAAEDTSTPVASATVTLIGTDLETHSLANGTFAFTDAPLGPVTVKVEAPGFATMVQEVVLSADAVVFMQFILPSLHAFLDEILVVGQRSSTGSTLSETRTAADMLAGQIPGISGNSGIVGLTLSTVHLRGVSSISIQSEPDLFLNGVRMAGSFGDALQLLQMIPASDVKDIRILRGPTAAFLHGSADGAIHIRTRSGPEE